MDCRVGSQSGFKDTAREVHRTHGGLDDGGYAAAAEVTGGGDAGRSAGKEVFRSKNGGVRGSEGPTRITGRDDIV
jgi:hypothetical protein